MIDNEYIYLIVPFVSMVTAQVIKFIIESIQHRKVRWGRLFNGCGGMPSTHTAFTFSLVMLIAFKDGITSISFAIALVFALVVAYDAMGLRMESGNQAVAINRILDEIFSDKTKDGVKHLKEQLGHKPLEVVMGMVLGTAISMIFLVI